MFPTCGSRLNVRRAAFNSEIFSLLFCWRKLDSFNTAIIYSTDEFVSDMNIVKSWNIVNENAGHNYVAGHRNERKYSKASLIVNSSGTSDSQNICQGTTAKNPSPNIIFDFDVYTRIFHLSSFRIVDKCTGQSSTKMSSSVHFKVCSIVYRIFLCSLVTPYTASPIIIF